MKPFFVEVEGSDPKADGGYPRAVAALRGVWSGDDGEMCVGTMLVVVWPDGLMSNESLKDCRARPDGGAEEGF